MTLALLHRRFTAALALSALAAFAAGAGTTPWLLLVGAAIAATAVRLPPAGWAPRVERGARAGIVALCAWMLFVAFVLRQDFMPAVMAMLLFLLVAESARPLEARNDGRLYLLSFALLLAATAFYPGLGFAAAFAAFVVFSTLALTVGYLRRQAERFGMPGVRPGRRMLATLAALSVVTLLISATLFLLFPRLPRQWNVQGRRPGGEAMAGFSDQVRLGQHGGRIGSNPQTAFRVEFLEGPPADPASTYWRGRSFDHFDGERWSRTRRPSARRMGTPPLSAWEGGTRRVRIFGGPPEAPVLFGPHAVLAVEPRSAIQVMQEASGDILYRGSDAPVYTVVSTARQPADAALRAAGGAPPWPAPGNYLQLPPLDPAVRRLADSLTSGHAYRIDRVRAVEHFLSTRLEYSLDLPSTAAEATVEGFLFRRRAGHCEYFSTAMVVLLRSVGIPTRNVTGFAGGEWNEFGGYLVVTGDQAHSWVEVWFGDLGWVAFDPTPPSRARDAAVARSAWPFRLWIDGFEYRWYRWVVDYNLERQLTLLSRVGDLFSRGGAAGAPAAGGRGGGTPPGWLAAGIALAMAAGLLASARRPGRGRRSPETRAYLALRRAYARAGVGPRGGPLDFAEALCRARAPGAEPARAAVELYLRARFGGARPGKEDRRRMAEAVSSARAALRRARRGRDPRQRSLASF